MYFSRKNIRSSTWSALRETLLRPQQYFINMPITTNYFDSLLLLTIIYLVPILILDLSLISYFTLAFTLELASELVLILLCLGVLFTWIWSAYFAWASRVFCKKHIPRAEMFQIISYSNMPNALAWIPLFVPLAWLWFLYLSWHGLVHRYQITSEAATLMVIVPLTLMFSAFIAILMFIGLSMSGNDIDLLDYIFKYFKTVVINAQHKTS
ncbi:MAG: YIP1 family protein [Mariprofundales bacterium]